MIFSIIFNTLKDQILGFKNERRRGHEYNKIYTSIFSESDNQDDDLIVFSEKAHSAHDIMVPKLEEIIENLL